MYGWHKKDLDDIIDVLRVAVENSFLEETGVRVVEESIIVWQQNYRGRFANRASSHR